MELEKAKSDLQKALDVQCSNGNWNVDPYMHGMANGMIFAMSCLTGEEPRYLKTPETWLSNLPKEKIDTLSANDVTHIQNQFSKLF